MATTIAREDAKDIERKRCDAIVCQEWQKAVREFELRPGNITEKVVSRIIERIRFEDVAVADDVKQAYKQQPATKGNPS